MSRRPIYARAPEATIRAVAAEHAADTTCSRRATSSGRRTTRLASEHIREEQGVTAISRPVATAVPSLWAPLRVAAFRALWFAQLGTMLGVWMQTVGAQWLLVARPDSAALVALVQVASMVPMLLFALPAGALADIMDGAAC